MFYGILVQHFAALAGELPVPVAHLDAMVPLLVQSTSEVPYYAATVARARLARMHERLSAGLSGNPVSSVAQAASGKQGAKAGVKQPPQQQQVPESAWPAPRALLQLKLFASLFPTSDRRHPVRRVTTAGYSLYTAVWHAAVASPLGHAQAHLAVAAELCCNRTCSAWLCRC